MSVIRGARRGASSLEVAVEDLALLEGEAVVDLGQHGVLLAQHHGELLAEDLLVEQVLHAKPDAGRLVGIGRADPGLGRAQLVLPEVALGRAVDLVVVRHDQVGVSGDDEAARVHAACLERVALGDEHRRVDHDAVADHRDDVRVEHPRWHQLEREVLAVDDDRVPGVVAPLVAHDHVHVGSKEIGELSLALVAPLRPDHHGRRHAVPLLRPSPGAPVRGWRAGERCSCAASVPPLGSAQAALGTPNRTRGPERSRPAGAGHCRAAGPTPPRRPLAAPRGRASSCRAGHAWLASGGPRPGRSSARRIPPARPARRGRSGPSASRTDSPRHRR